MGRLAAFACLAASRALYWTVADARRVAFACVGPSADRPVVRICFPSPGRSGHERPKTESGKPLLEQILFFRQRFHKGFKHRGSTQAGEGGALHTEEGRGGSQGQSGASKAAEAGNARGNARGNAGSCAGGFPGQCGDSKGRGTEMSSAEGTKKTQRLSVL